jgi:predicted HTH transcriptional regulator
MTEIHSLDLDQVAALIGIEEISEDLFIEIKEALGPDGKGRLPESFFQTYSAMSNTRGGVVVFGFRQLSSGEFTLIGIERPDRIISQLWSSLNNPQKVNGNILNDTSVDQIDIHGRIVIKVTIPPAKRTQKPIYIGQNPLTGTYRRDFDGDYRCDEETVKRMLAEQVEDSRDNHILEGFSDDDLNIDTLKTYRTAFRTVKPTHPWNNLDDREFLRSIGGYRKDRQTGKEGLTVAGILMFGNLRSILDALPNYLLDYQEQDALSGNHRWIDRVTTDGSWSGNLYDFYNIVIQRLSRDLRVPFRLEGTTRIDDTPIKEAIREAFTNTIIHADYSVSVPIQIIKRQDMFRFRNPGTMRIPIADAIRGGLSDCRNRSLQMMFDLVGYGERAGSGLPKIFQRWSEQLWRRPELFEKASPDQTILILRMISLLPKDVETELEERFGVQFLDLSYIKKLALATVAIEGSVNHPRLREMSDMHPHDLSKELKELVVGRFLSPTGSGRATVYTFFEPRRKLEQRTLEDLPVATPSALRVVSTESKLSSESLATNSESLATSSKSLSRSSEFLQNQSLIDEKLRGRKKVPPTEMKEIIEIACSQRFLTIREIGAMVHRSHHSLRSPLIELIKEGRIELEYPESLNHPHQRYRANQGNIQKSTSNTA